MKTYLSGGMEYTADEGHSWRAMMHEWLEKTLSHSVFNPNEESDKFFALHYPSVNIRQLKQQDILRYVAIIEQLVRLDIEEIAQRSDYVICYWDEGAQRGAGTKGEITIAKFFSKPVYLITQIPLEEIPGWVLACSTQIFPGFDELKEHLLSVHRREEV
jgi:hypothetical protein